MKDIGISGVIAKAFIKSKLTPLIVLASLLLGVFALLVTSREEEPQIVVPMIDVIVTYPGATAKEVEERVTKPMEKFLWEIKGVEYIYSIVKPGMNLTIVRFYVGEDMEKSLVNLHTKLMSHYDRIPAGVSQPLVKPKSIDDVPILTLTLWNEKGQYSGYELRRVAVEVADELKKDMNVSEFSVIGGQKRQVRVNLDPARLRAYHIPAVQIIQTLQQANFVLPSGAFPSNNEEFLVETGGFLANIEEVGRVVVAVADGKPIYLREVADLFDGPEEPADYVFMNSGPAAADKNMPSLAAPREAVTIAISKKKGANASTVASEALAKIDKLRGGILPSDIQVTVTRNYGETAKEKSNELLDHMLIATISVIILMALTLGWRESLVVAVAVPVTLALTLLINYLYGYTLNRVTLFALIFSIGILVDDAIVVVENIHRHFKLHGVSTRTAVQAVDEVGSPTILATFAVIFALLPMAFVRGLMGPYMRPIPVGASAAMLFSLLVAFIVSPWLSYKVLKNVKSDAPGEQETSRLHDLYERILGPLLDHRGKRVLMLVIVAVLLFLSILLVPFKGVTVKMLPFDNKSEVQVIIDMREGVSLERTAALARELGDYLQTVPEVTDFQTYVGTAAPYNFNGLVRHYFLRQGSNVADIQVNFVGKGQRKMQSHDLAKRLRPPLKEIGDRYGARIKVVEIPPGPPVLSTLVAEVYGPDTAGQVEIAREIRNIFETTDGVVDVDWFVEDDQTKFTFAVDKEKAAYHGISTTLVAQSLRMALNGTPAGLVHYENEKEPVELMLRASLPERAGIAALQEVTVPAADGSLIPLAALVRISQGVENKTIYHKNLKRVTYVIGDVAGAIESPVYAILEMKDRVAQIPLKEGYELQQYSAEQPWLETKYAMKWDGEWQITYEVFRDLGMAFAAVLVLIYILVVAWFRSFVTPLVIMAPIPLTLVGILPGHWLFGAFFTATSMIGFIALSGIIVRNSVLLVDFVQMEWLSSGSLRTALITAGAVRLRPIVLTALAVVVGSFVMIFDPIFQGLAIAMMFGAVAATALTLVAVPLLYFEFFQNRKCPLADEEETDK
ncbi:MAG: efflux RND transporter permease subunit [Proteobacteria bacterium]|nr:efflux RND transporter permease subunit [Pseudomonadota bacterium]MBU4296610.1 efflux RND transporter permease subunit [Pseudomonadota bacterium]MCG2748239.1 efflux RND transporter permease subunit [Desulfobulbaceae bacterium]